MGNGELKMGTLESQISKHAVNQSSFAAAVDSRLRSEYQSPIENFQVSILNPAGLQSSGQRFAVGAFVSDRQREDLGLISNHQ